mgnify:CR=1 FL=1
MKITLAIGSNILQQKNIDEAQSRLRHLLPGIVFGEAVWTTPIGIQSDRFLNLLAYADTPLSLDHLQEALKAIEAHVQSGAEMVLYSVNAISGSTESQGEVTVRLQSSGRVVNGVGADPDIVVASAKEAVKLIPRPFENLWLKSNAISQPLVRRLP